MIKTDCIHFPLDKPCRFHKKTGKDCPKCNHYYSIFNDSKNVKKILIIKLDAMGDVLRTTFLLPGLKQKYPDAEITWIVAQESVQILEGNPYIDRIWVPDKDIFAKLLLERFNISINFDLSPTSLSLATISVAENKIGFWLNSRRRIKHSNFPAYQWLQMSGSDNRKKQNNHTYQYWMSQIVGLPKADYRIYVPLRKDSLARADVFARKHKLNKNTVVGINPGAGKRWKLKKWTDQGYIELIKKLSDSGIKVLLFGGHQEKELIYNYVKKSGNKAITTGTDNNLPDFFALINLCDLVITGDTLALHTALGLNKKVVAIFGPTSAKEIEMYDQGIKIVSDAKCVCCYRQVCDKKPNCMERINTETVWNAVRRLLNL